MPTPVLHIELLHGPGMGRTVSFTQSPVSFGREADNTLIVTESFVSRRHGEFRLTGERWELVNLSPNGTRLNRKLIRETQKPQALRTGDEVTVGELAVFRVHLEAAPATAAKAPAGATARTAPVPQAPGAQSGPKGAGLTPGAGMSLTKRSKMLLSLIGLMMLSLFVLWILLDQGGGSSGTGPDNQQILAGKEIARLIKEPLASKPVDPALARQKLLDAADLYAGSTVEHAKRYKAYRAYQESLVYAGLTTFSDPQDQWKFLNLQKNVVDDIVSRYHNAYNLYQAGQYPQAKAGFSKLATDLFNLVGGDQNHPLYRNVMDWQIAAGKR